jgi:hypothetical protein
MLYHAFVILNSSFHQEFRLVRQYMLIRLKSILKVIDTKPPLEKVIEHIELFSKGISLEHMHEHHEEHKN